jgi:hypothetical protein
MDKVTKLPVPEQGQPAPAPAPALMSREVFEFISEHFLLISAIVIALAVAATAAGLGAYLRVFDWRLIWIIEYADVLKWGLVALVLLSAFAFSGLYLIDSMEDATKANWRRIKIGLALWALSFVGALVANYYASPEPGRQSLLIALHMTALMIAATTLVIVGTVRSGFRLRHVLGDVVIFIVTAGFVGTAIAHFVRDLDGFKHNVAIKEGPEYRSVGLVMMTSRYVVLWDRDHALILPVDDISKIEGSRRRASKRAPACTAPHPS